jgi:hypothetical protein
LVKDWLTNLYGMLNCLLGLGLMTFAWFGRASGDFSSLGSPFFGDGANRVRERYLGGSQIKKKGVFWD